MAQQPYRTFFSTASGWGCLVVDKHEVCIELKEGELAVDTLVVQFGDAPAIERVPRILAQATRDCRIPLNSWGWAPSPLSKGGHPSIPRPPPSPLGKGEMRFLKGFARRFAAQTPSKSLSPPHFGEGPGVGCQSPNTLGHA